MFFRLKQIKSTIEIRQAIGFAMTRLPGALTEINCWSQ
jgi:hypothetical protein